jgi:hypothetical protein
MGVELTPIDLPTEYMREAGGLARQRIVAAGLRLGALLKDTPGSSVPPSSLTPAPIQAAVSRPSTSAEPAAVKPEAARYWLNTSSNVRHNSSCKWFDNTKRGRFCSAAEGKPCGECGG